MCAPLSDVGHEGDGLWVKPPKHAPGVSVRLPTGEECFLQMQDGRLKNAHLEEASQLWATQVKDLPPLTIGTDAFIPLPHPLAIFARLTVRHNPLFGPGYPRHREKKILIGAPHPLRDELTGRVLVPVWLDLDADLGPQLEQIKAEIQPLQEQYLKASPPGRSHGTGAGKRVTGRARTASRALHVLRFMKSLAGQGPKQILMGGDAAQGRYGDHQVSDSNSRVLLQLGDASMLVPYAFPRPYPLS
jgi:hypothetical protein